MELCSPNVSQDHEERLGALSATLEQPIHGRVSGIFEPHGALSAGILLVFFRWEELSPGTSTSLQTNIDLRHPTEREAAAEEEAEMIRVDFIHSIYGSLVDYILSVITP